MEQSQSFSVRARRHSYPQRGHAVHAPDDAETLFDSLGRRSMPWYWPVIALFQHRFSVFTWVCPGIILILLALAYEFSGRKNYGPMKYDAAVLDYTFTPEGWRSLTVEKHTATFPWKQATLRRTRSDFLLYSDKKNSSASGAQHGARPRSRPGKYSLGPPGKHDIPINLV